MTDTRQKEIVKRQIEEEDDLDSGGEVLSTANYDGDTICLFSTNSTKKTHTCRYYETCTTTYLKKCGFGTDAIDSVSEFIIQRYKKRRLSLVTIDAFMEKVDTFILDSLREAIEKKKKKLEIHQATLAAYDESQNKIEEKIYEKKGGLCFCWPRMRTSQALENKLNQVRRNMTNQIEKIIKIEEEINELERNLEKEEEEIKTGQGFYTISTSTFLC